MITGLLMALAALALGAPPSDGQPSTTAMDIETSIRGQLRPGTPRLRVVEFLREHHVAFRDSPDPRSPRVSPSIRAVLSTTTAGPRPRVLEIQVTFEFDGNDRLSTYSSRWQITGP